MTAVNVHAYRGQTAGSEETPYNEKFDLSSVLTDPVYVQGNNGADYIVSASGHDLLYGGSGRDVIVSGDGRDTIFGDEYWNDERVFFGLMGRERFNPDDVILSGAGDDVIHAGGGIDKVNSGSGNDFIDGFSGADTIFGGFGNDTVFGGAGNDIIYGGTPQTLDLLDYVSISGGFNGLNDTFGSAWTAGSGVTGLGENAFSDLGIDYLDGGDGNDLIVGGDGSDTLLGGAGDDTIDGGAGVDTVEAGAGSDVVGGGDGNDAISGGDGNDYLDGQAGADYILGGDGEDLVFGGLLNDVLSGGTGSDVFLFRAGDGSDILMDFVPGSQADVLALQNTGLGSFADVQAHMSYYSAGNATYIQIGSEQIFFANVLPHQFDASDFVFV
jgi:Ca2+-binding RTX toxin-like protein